jgi:transmembrane sensor
MQITRELLRKYSEGRCNAEEIKTVEEWLASGEWTVEDTTPTPAGEVKHAIWNKVGAKAGLRPLRRIGAARSLRTWLQVAAILLIVIGGASVALRLFHAKYGAGGGMVTITAEQQRKKIWLSDSSVVFIAPGSSVSMRQPFGGDRREIVLTGEASFEVAKDAHRPFTVVSGLVRTTALGTSFKVAASGAGDSSRVHVALSSGRVVVCHQPKDASADSIYLSPGESADYSASGARLLRSDANRHPFNFREDILFLKNADVPEVMEKLTGLYHVRIRYAALKNVHWKVSGEFDGQSLDIVLKSIAYTCNIRYTLEKDNLILEPLTE